MLHHRHKLLDVVPHGDGGGAGGLLVVRAVFARLLPGTDDAPGGVDDGTPAILLEGILYILGGAALGPVAGHQQEGVGHPGAELL